MCVTENVLADQVMGHDGVRRVRFDHIIAHSTVTGVRLLSKEKEVGKLPVKVIEREQLIYIIFSIVIGEEDWG